MVAVIETGGKQYLVSKGMKLSVEKVDLKKDGDEMTFDRVMLVADGNKISIGQPLVSGAKVSAIVLKQYRADKITVLKYKPKIRYRKKSGHRQSMTQVEITGIAA